MSIAARVSAVAVILVSLVLPSSAHARNKKTWWDFLEELSGPGRWQGLMLEAKVFCFGKHWSLADEQKALGDYWAAKGNAWIRDLGKAIPNDLLKPLSFVVVGGGDTTGQLEALVSNTKQNADAARNWCKENGGSCNETAQEAVAAFERQARELQQRIEMAVKHWHGFTPGIALSACLAPEGIPKRNSIDLGIRFMSYTDSGTAPAEAWAGGNPMKLVTLVGSYNWRVFSKPRGDALTLGMGAGIYWFSSTEEKGPGTGFDAFSGFILEPVKVTAHIPEKLVENTCWWWTTLIQGRAGFVGFPGGFRANAFGPGTGKVAQRLGGELVPYYGVFIDIDPLIRRANR